MSRVQQAYEAKIRELYGSEVGLDPQAQFVIAHMKILAGVIDTELDRPVVAPARPAAELTDEALADTRPGAAQFFHSINWRLLSRQKARLTVLCSNLVDEDAAAVAGVMALIDDMQDVAIQIGAAAEALVQYQEGDENATLEELDNDQAA